MLNYEEVSGAEFHLPEDAIHFDVGADGRLYAVGEDALWRESAPGSRSFLSVLAPNFGVPEFIRVSPSGRKAAVGNYAASKVYVFDLGATTAIEISATSYDAEWFNERFIAVSNQGADGPSPPSEVALVDSVAGTVRTVISGIPGYSGGVTFDVDGNLYTGIGVAVPTGPDTGLIKAFRFDDWKALMSGPGTALDFSTKGRAAANVLSAAFLTFDADWNLCIAGGGGTDAVGSPDMGYAGVVSHSGLCAALYDQPPVNTDAPGHTLQRIDPTPSDSNEYWLLNTNPVRRELYLKKYDSDTVTVFRQALSRSLVRTDFQLGDNPGFFAGKRFVGMMLSMPIQLPTAAEFGGDLCVRVSTSSVESLGVSAHSVRLNAHEIGKIKGSQFNTIRETSDFQVPRATALALIASRNPAELSISVDRAPGPGLADDFVLESVEVLFVAT